MLSERNSVSKGYIIYDSMYITCGKGKIIGIANRPMVPRGLRRGEGMDEKVSTRNIFRRV